MEDNQVNDDNNKEAKVGVQLAGGKFYAITPQGFGGVLEGGGQRIHSAALMQATQSPQKPKGNTTSLQC